MELLQEKPAQSLDEGIWLSKVETVERYWVDRARKNPVDFITYLTDGEKRPSNHQIDWIRAIFDFSVRNLIIEAFPGSTKTTTLVYCMAYLIGVLPWLTHVICSVSEEQAKQRVAELREIIESERYKSVFPHVHIETKRPNNSTELNVWSSKWSDGREISYREYRNLVTKYGEPRDDTVFACGITSRSITGKRITGFILVDDPHNETNSATPDQREKVTNAIKKELMSRFSHTHKEWCKLVIIMTPWAEDDCAGRLLQDKRRDGTKMWSLMKTPICDESGEPIWKEAFTREDVEEIRAGRGDIIFDLMYMLDSLALAGKQITLDMLRQAIPNPPPQFRDITITTDFSETDKITSDWNVFLAVARDELKRFNCYMLDGIRFKDASYANRVDMLEKFIDDITEKYGTVRRIIFEEVDSRAEIEMLREKRPDFPIFAIRTKGDKELRWKSCAGIIQQMRWYFNIYSPVYSVMQSEMIGFPKSSHDDCVDPCSLLFQQDDWAWRIQESGVIIIKDPLIL